MNPPGMQFAGEKRVKWYTQESQEMSLKFENEALNDEGNSDKTLGWGWGGGH